MLSKKAELEVAQLAMLREDAAIAPEDLLAKYTPEELAKLYSMQSKTFFGLFGGGPGSDMLGQKMDAAYFKNRAPKPRGAMIRSKGPDPFGRGQHVKDDPYGTYYYHKK